MKRTVRIARNSSNPLSVAAEECQEYRVRVIGMDGKVLTEIDELTWEAIRPHVSEYGGRFTRIEVMPAAGLKNPD